MDVIKITKDSRIFSEIDSLVIVIASLAISLEFKLTGAANFKPDNFIILEGFSTGKMVRLPLFGPIETALKGLKPDSIEITIEDMKPSIQTYQETTSALRKTINYVFSPYFVTFYEKNYEEAKQKFDKDYNKWPSSWRMGWVVRNALSHNGRVFFRNLEKAQIEWKGVSISPVHQDTPIENFLNFTDILILLFDMEFDLK
jgi:hypothetical protein